MPSDFSLYSNIYSWGRMTDAERREYLSAHVGGTDDGNERELAAKVRRALAEVRRDG